MFKKSKYLFHFTAQAPEEMSRNTQAKAIDSAWPTKPAGSMVSAQEGQNDAGPTIQIMPAKKKVKREQRWILKMVKKGSG